MVFSDWTICQQLVCGEISISSLANDAIQPASVDLRLAREVLFYKKRYPTLVEKIIDVRYPVDGLMESFTLTDSKGIILPSSAFALASTIEEIALSSRVVARIEGRSSLGRLGLLVHATAGYVDPGFKGHLTLELFNASPYPILLWYGMKICQLAFEWTTTPVNNEYGSPNLRSKYQNQSGPQISLLSQDFEHNGG